MSTSREYWERIRPAFLAGILLNILARGQALFGSLYSIEAVISRRLAQMLRRAPWAQALPGLFPLLNEAGGSDPRRDRLLRITSAAGRSETLMARIGLIGSASLIVALLVAAPMAVATPAPR